MRFTYSIVFVLVVAVGLGGCRAKVAENSNVEQQDVAAATSRFASITDASAALAEGNKLLDENDTEVALEAYKRAVELDPNLGEAYFKMGIAYALLETEAMHSGGAERLPGDMPANSKLSKTNSVKMFEKAVDVYQKYLNDNPKDAAAHYNLGLAFSKLDKDEDAEGSLEKATKLSPDESLYLIALGSIRIKLAKYHEAMAVLKKAVELSPDDPEAADLLDEAEAGARRVDYVGPKTNTNSNARPSNSNTNSSGTSTASNSAPPANVRPSNSNPTKPQPKPSPERMRVVKP